MELIVRHGEHEERVRVRRTPEGYRVVVGERTYRVDYVATGPAMASLLIDGHQSEVSVQQRADGRYWVSSSDLATEVEVTDPLTDLARRSSGAARATGVRQVTAYMPGRVAAVLVEEGQRVEKGQGVVVLEAMKMENEIQAESDGVVRQVFVAPGQPVETGDPLFEME